jgi:hypothetical protein
MHRPLLKEHKMSRKKLGNESFAPPAPDELTPISLFSLMLSTSALCNATSRWLMANERELAEYGGYAAATDLQLVADVLLAMCEENLEVWQSMMVNMPKGFAHIPWDSKAGSTNEKGDLPF